MILNAVSSLKTFPEADPNRIGLWGHSMGGFLTLRAMVISPDIRAGVIWAGVVGSYPDMICCWRTPVPGVPTSTPNPNFRSGWRRSWQEIYAPAENPILAAYRQIIQDLSGPVQLHHGTADTDVPIAFSRSLLEQITGAGKTVEFYEYPQDNHNLSNYFNLAMNRTIEFFDHYLKGT
jgi:dipeptidyl aminopeptidase/acylaminoacyl peptidase